MNFYDYVLRDSPRVAFKPNAAGTTWTDISGNGYPNYLGTQTKTSAMVAGNDYSLIISPSTAFKFSVGEVWKIGKEFQPFTIECVLLPLVSVGDMGVASHSSGTPPDGIHIDSNKIYFDVVFGAGRVSAAWEYPDVVESYTLHAIYTPNKLQLWANAVLVAETSIPDGFVASGFSYAPDADLYAGNSSSNSDKAGFDGLAFYNYSLTEDQIKQHFNAVRDVVTMEQNVLAQGGSWRDGTDRNIYLQKTFNDTATFYSDNMTNVSIADGDLKPALDATTNLSLAGTWVGRFEITSDDISTIAGIKAEWNANGVYTVQSSLDGGSTWSAVTNGEMIAASQGLNPSGKILLVKVTFPGGLSNDPAEIHDLTLTAYLDYFAYGSNNSRLLQLNSLSSTSLVRNEPIESNSRPGIHVYGSTMIMLADPDATPTMIRTMEFWVNPKGVVSGTGGYLFDTRPSGGTAYMWLQESATTWGFTGATAVYINGQPVSNGVAAKKNEWVHVIFVFPADFNTNVSIAAGLQIAEYNLIATYPTAFTAAQALAQYQNYSRVPVASIVDPGVVTVFEPANPYVLTMRDWTNLPQQ
jgi:hypothetical protein